MIPRSPSGPRVTECLLEPWQLPGRSGFPDGPCSCQDFWTQEDRQTQALWGPWPPPCPKAPGKAKLSHPGRPSPAPCPHVPQTTGSGSSSGGRASCQPRARGDPREEQWSPAQGPAWTDARDHDGRVCGTALFESAARAPGSRRPPPSPWVAGRGGQRPASLLRAPGGCRVHWKPRGAWAPWTRPQRHRLPRAPSHALGGASRQEGPGAPSLSCHMEGWGAWGATYREDLVCAGDWGGKGPR